MQLQRNNELNVVKYEEFEKFKQLDEEKNAIF